MRKPLAMVTVLCMLFASKAAAEMRPGVRIFAGEVPQVRLIAPTGETVDLSSKKTPEFKWSPHEGSPFEREYYDFRLYRGYDMVESALISKEEMSPATYSIKFNSDTFKDGDVYTWSLRQVYSGGQKSHRSYSSFKVIKK